ncbi:33743_t:CDS:2, partial [Racocetra persica]
QEGYSAHMQSDDHLFEESGFGANLDPPMNPTHVQPPWDQLLERALKNSAWYTMLDLASGFWQ